MTSDVVYSSEIKFIIFWVVLENNGCGPSTQKKGKRVSSLYLDLCTTARRAWTKPNHYTYIMLCSTNQIAPAPPLIAEQAELCDRGVANINDIHR